MYKLIVAGCRDMTDLRYLSLLSWGINAFNSDFSGKGLEVVSGGAKGIDALGELWAKNANEEYKVFKADWDTHGKAAGPIRNREMAEYADGLLLIHRDDSPGSKNMLETMKKRGKKIVEIVVKQHNGDTNERTNQQN